MKTKYNFLSTDINCKDSISARRLLLVKTILFCAVPIFILFIILNIFFTHMYLLAFLELIAVSMSIYAISILKKDNDIPRAAQIATLNLTIFFILFIYTNGSSDFALIWTIFLPIFATLVNGKTIGLYFSLIYYAIIHIMAFNNIGVWEDGLWGTEDFLRLFFSSILLTYIMYVNEMSLEKSDKKLLEIRERESKYIESLHELSITDPLTELYNRRYFNDMAPNLISLAKRQKLILTFFILDIDQFKQYNDNYGHIEGDNALREIAKVLKKHVQRGDDFIFRLGGEEFAGITLSESMDDTHKWIGSICKLVEDLKIEHNFSDSSKYVTVSIGISSICPNNNFNIDKIYALADTALYKAKANGKNRAELNNQCI